MPITNVIKSAISKVQQTVQKGVETVKSAVSTAVQKASQTIQQIAQTVSKSTTKPTTTTTTTKPTTTTTTTPQTQSKSVASPSIFTPPSSIPPSLLSQQSQTSYTTTKSTPSSNVVSPYTTSSSKSSNVASSYITSSSKQQTTTKSSQQQINLNEVQKQLESAFSSGEANVEDMSSLRDLFQTTLEAILSRKEELDQLYRFASPPTIQDVFEKIKEARTLVGLDEVEQRYYDIYQKIISIPQAVEEEFSYEKTGLVYPTALISEEIERRIKPYKTVLDILSVELGRKEALLDTIMSQYQMERQEAREFLKLYMAENRQTIQDLVNLFDKTFDNFRQFYQLRQQETKEVLQLALKAPSAGIIPGVDDLTSAFLKAVPILTEKEIIDMQMKMFDLKIKELKAGQLMAEAVPQVSPSILTELVETWGRYGYSALEERITKNVPINQRMQYYSLINEQILASVKQNPEIISTWAWARASWANPSKPQDVFSAKLDEIFQELAPLLSTDEEALKKVTEYYSSQKETAKKEIKGILPRFMAEIMGYFFKPSESGYIEGRRADAFYNALSTLPYLGYEPPPESSLSLPVVIIPPPNK